MRQNHWKTDFCLFWLTHAHTPPPNPNPDKHHPRRRNQKRAIKQRGYVSAGGTVGEKGRDRRERQRQTKQESWGKIRKCWGRKITRITQTNICVECVSESLIIFVRLLILVCFSKELKYIIPCMYYIFFLWKTHLCHMCVLWKRKHHVLAVVTALSFILWLYLVLFLHCTTSVISHNSCTAQLLSHWRPSLKYVLLILKSTGKWLMRNLFLLLYY